MTLHLEDTGRNVAGLADAFHEVCDQAEESETHFVSLYVAVPYYGGPEEGGWWGTDVHLEATQGFPTKAQAEAARDRVEELARQATDAARRQWGDQCLRELDAAEARGMDAQDLFGETDGHDEYRVVIEKEPGSQSHRGCRYYE